jgi:hypothetical protein
VIPTEENLTDASNLVTRLTDRLLNRQLVDDLQGLPDQHVFEHNHYSLTALIVVVIRHPLVSFCAIFSIDITSSTFSGSMIASQVNGGEIDNHTASRTTVTMTVASTPRIPLTRILLGIPIIRPSRVGKRMFQVSVLLCAHTLLARVHC